MPRAWFLTALLVCASHVFAQSEPYIEITGDWRYQQGDEERFADPAFDDGGWSTVQIPRSKSLPMGSYWLRKRIELPAGTGSAPMYLMLGALPGRFQVYANGVLAGETQRFGEGFEPLQNPKVFEVPSRVLRTSTLHLALRITQTVATPGQGLNDRNTMLLAGKRSAELASERETYQRQVMRSPRVIDLVLLMVIAIGLFLIWKAGERSPAVLMLCAQHATLAMSSLFILLSMHEASFGARAFSVGWWLCVSFSSWATVEFAIQVFGVRAPYWKWVALGPVLMQPFANDFFPNLSFLLSTLRYAVTIVPTLLLSVWSLARGKRQDRAIAAFLGAYSVTVLGANYFRLFRSVVYVGPFEISLTYVSAIGIGFALLAALTKRFIAEQRERKRLAGELEAARAVQQLLLGQQLRDTGPFTVEATYQPAQEVGGDFYYVLSGGGGFLLTAGDVSGKGLRAAMLVSLLIGALRETRERTPAGVLRALNAALAGQCEGGFVTCCCARFDEGGSVRIANAGHVVPYLGNRELGLESGLPLGLLADADYAETQVILSHDETLTFLSDGVVEASNAAGELLGFERTQQLMGQSAAEIARAARQWGQNDDITVVTVRRAIAPTGFSLGDSVDRNRR